MYSYRTFFYNRQIGVIPLHECSCENPEVERMYERPKGRIVNKINAGLGPLPEGIEYPDPSMLSAEEGKWSRRLWALVTLALCWRLH